MKREDVYGFAHAQNREVREKGNELEFKRCPYCDGGFHNDYWTFSVNLDSGAFKCLRSSCGKQGHFVELCRDMDYQLNVEPPKIYKPFPHWPKPESRDEAVEYLKGRGISEEITRKYHITVTKDNPKILVFPFYNESGELVNIKYRRTDFDKAKHKNKEWSEKDRMPILFGMDNCEDFERLIVTEGQIDALSVAESGIKNAVSVPTGASGFTWVNYCRDWVMRFKEVVVFGDCEHGKVTLVDKMLANLPKMQIKVVQVKDYLGEKDANDILRKFGPEAVRKCIEGAEVPSLNCVKQLADVQSIDINKIEKITTGIPELDRVIRGMCVGQLVILTGKRGEGKSTLMSQFVADALDQRKNVFVYSGELADFHFKFWLDCQLAGEAKIREKQNQFGDMDYSLDETVVDELNKWYRGRAFIYDNTFTPNGSELETLPKTIERVIVQHHAQLICVDNLMTAMEKVTEQNNLNLAQSNFVGQLKALAVQYNVVIVLVAHPKKGNADTFQDDNDLVAGSSDITNKADIVIKYSRCDDPDDPADGLIKVTKNRIMGVLKTRNEDAIRV
jgi:twinkle protein